MATTTRSLLNRVVSLLNDEEHTRWTESELLEWVNDGQRVIAKETTDATPVRANITAVTGTVQNLPSTGFRLIEVLKDVSSGNAIRQGDYDTLNTYDRNWRTVSSGTAELYFYDERNPTQFEVFPKQAGGESIEIIYADTPADTTTSGSINIDDMYVDSLVDYVAYRALSKDTEDASPELGRATAFYRAFLLGIGKKDAVDALVEPPRS